MIVIIQRCVRERESGRNRTGEEIARGIERWEENMRQSRWVPSSMTPEPNRKLACAEGVRGGWQKGSIPGTAGEDSLYRRVGERRSFPSAPPSPHPL